MTYWESLLARNLIALQPFAIVGLSFEHSGSLTERALGGNITAFVFVSALVVCLAAILIDWFCYVIGKKTFISDHMSGIALFTAGLLAAVAIFSATTSASFVLPVLYVWAAAACAYASHGYARDARRNR